VPRTLGVGLPVAQVRIVGARRVVQRTVLREGVLRVLELNDPHSPARINANAVKRSLHTKPGIKHNRLRPNKRNAAPTQNSGNNRRQRPRNAAGRKTAKRAVKPAPKNKPARLGPRPRFPATPRQRQARRPVRNPAHQRLPEVRRKPNVVGRRRRQPSDKAGNVSLAEHHPAQQINARCANRVYTYAATAVKQK